MPAADLRALARRIADAGVAVTVLPATDLFMMGRDQDHTVRRGVADVNLLVGAWRELLDVHQQRAEPVHAVRRCVAAAHGESAGQCLPDRRSGTAARVLRHADGTVRAADEPDGLWHQGWQSGRSSWCWTRRRRSRRWRRSCQPLAVFKRGQAHGDAARAELHGRSRVYTDAAILPASDGNRIAYTSTISPIRGADTDAAAAACRDGVIEALVRRGAALCRHYRVVRMDLRGHGECRCRRRSRR